MDFVRALNEATEWKWHECQDAPPPLIMLIRFPMHVFDWRCCDRRGWLLLARAELQEITKIINDLACIFKIYLFQFSACQNKRYGPNCNNRCQCANDVTCDEKTGKCPSGCNDRFTGPYCNIGKGKLIACYLILKLSNLSQQRFGREFIIVPFRWNIM
jgi:hypothetical protein